MGIRTVVFAAVVALASADRVRRGFAGGYGGVGVRRRLRRGPLSRLRRGLQQRGLPTCWSGGARTGPPPSQVASRAAYQAHGPAAGQDAVANAAASRAAQGAASLAAAAASRANAARASSLAQAAHLSKAAGAAQANAYLQASQAGYAAAAAQQAYAAKVGGYHGASYGGYNNYGNLAYARSNFLGASAYAASQAADARYAQSAANDLSFQSALANHELQSAGGAAAQASAAATKALAKAYGAGLGHGASGGSYYGYNLHMSHCLQTLHVLYISV
nr:spidroin-1-like [Penaeus vannamei]